MSAAVLFVAGYALSCAALLPASALTVGAGAAFGLAKGFLLVTLGANLGANLCFWLGRTFLRARVRRWLARWPAAGAVFAAVGKEGWRGVLLIRLTPAPFNLVNYGLGLTDLRARDYATATLVGMVPGTLLFTSLGAAAGAAREGRTPAEWALTAVGLAAGAAAAWLIGRRAKAELERAA